MSHTPENSGLNQSEGPQKQADSADAREAEARRLVIEAQKEKERLALERKKVREDVRRFMADPEAVKREEEREKHKELWGD